MEELEDIFGVTLRRDGPLGECADRGISHVNYKRDFKHLKVAMGDYYDSEDILLTKRETWKLPSGAFQHSGGPT
jgi:hypothetical protein